ncbi:MAG: hypothetical protein P8K68_09690 [Algibacter sp.]|uniref:hypothetical protein n=1 Tax=Algibacter sp. TaxID=1872428 RepID=UPI0026292BBC|nr:hypothetical protein [Algibacter sp.]MDG2179042.1 hypothetical protein [Algibacter sp.]
MPALLFSIFFVSSMLSQEIELGIHRSNFIWLEQDKVEEINDGIKNIDPDLIRISAVKGRGTIERVLEHISYANEIGPSPSKLLLFITIFSIVPPASNREGYMSVQSTGIFTHSFCSTVPVE